MEGIRWHSCAAAQDHPHVWQPQRAPLADARQPLVSCGCLGSTAALAAAAAAHALQDGARPHLLADALHAPKVGKLFAVQRQGGVLLHIVAGPAHCRGACDGRPRRWRGGWPLWPVASAAAHEQGRTAEASKGVATLPVCGRQAGWHSSQRRLGARRQRQPAEATYGATAEVQEQPADALNPPPPPHTTHTPPTHLPGCHRSSGSCSCPGTAGDQ